MRIEDDRYCFVCGTHNDIGLHADITTGQDNTAYTKLVIPKNFQGWQDIVHGGIISTLLDEVSIYACRNISQKGVTAEITVKFKKPVPTETEIELRSKVVEIKRRLLLVEAELLVGGIVHASAETKIFNLE